MPLLAMVYGRICTLLLLPEADLIAFLHSYHHYTTCSITFNKKGIVSAPRYVEIVVFFALAILAPPSYPPSYLRQTTVPLAIPPKPDLVLHIWTRIPNPYQ